MVIFQIDVSNAPDRPAEQSDVPVFENESSRPQAGERPDTPKGDDSASRSEEVSSDAGDASAGKDGGVIAQTARTFVTKTLEACAEHLARVAAYSAGVGLAFEILVFLYMAGKWARVAQGDGGVEVTTPLLLGPGVDLDISLRIDGDSGELPVGMYVGPPEDAPVGVLVFGPLTVEPAPDHRDHKREKHEPQEHPKVPPSTDEKPRHRDDEPTRVELPSADAAVALLSERPEGQPYCGVVAVSLDLSPFLPLADQAITQEEREATAPVARTADESLRAVLWTRRQTLLNADVDLIFGYDPTRRRAVVLHVSDQSRPQRQVFIGLDSALGHLSIKVIDATHRLPETG